MDIIRKLIRSINFAKSWIQLDLTFLVLKGNQQIRDKKAWILSSFPIFFYFLQFHLENNIFNTVQRELDF